MKLSQVVTSLSAVALSGLLTTTMAFASYGDELEKPGKQALVALGDSISFGYNLGENNDHPSKYAFPFLIGKAEEERVRDLAVPGATSSDLLSSLKSEQFQKAIKHADVVTLDIGSNDLLTLAGKFGLLSGANVTVTPEMMLAFQVAIQQFSSNLPLIIESIHEQAPSAKIVLYNLYDPIPNLPSSMQLHGLSEQLLGLENYIIAATAEQFGLPVADAHAAFDNKQLALVRVVEGDVHPTIAGQEVLAQLGEQILNQMEVDVNQGKKH